MKLMAIDGNSLINRAFYGVRPLNAADGTPTNAVFGFLNMLFKLRDDLTPDAICVCFDLRAKTFRHLAYDGYKAQRKPMPEDLAAQIPLVKQALDLLGICRMEQEGFEADDLLGTLARLSNENGDTTVIVTGDRDSLQFIGGNTTVSLIISRLGQTTTENIDDAAFAEKYSGLTPPKIVDLKAIMGDSSDNIPGVRGIGEKGAMDLLVRFGSLDNIYSNLDDKSISDSVRKKLIESRDMAYLSYKLALGERHAPIDKTLNQLLLMPPDRDGLYRFLDKLELRALIKRLELTPPKTDAPKTDFIQHKRQNVENAAALSALMNNIKALGAASCAVAKSFAACAVTLDGATYCVTADDVGQEGMDSLLRLLFEKTRLTLHDGKPLCARLIAQGALPMAPDFDTCIAAYLLDPTAADYSFEKLAPQFLGIDALPAIYDQEDAFTLLGVSEEALCALAQHSCMAQTLRGVLEQRLESVGMTALLRDMELPLLLTLARMEAYGMAVDKEKLLAFGDSLTAEIAPLEEKIYALAGEKFNISSPKQLGIILFESLGLRPPKKTKTGYSTDAEVLEKLRGDHEIVACILDYRKLTKLRSTYVEGLTKVIHPDGRIHSTFNQTVTATGRLSSTEPNLQNIPIRREQGAEVRQSFIAPRGRVLIDADYSQIELRILAHIAHDPIMLKAFAENEDIHRVTASQVFHVPPLEVTSTMRSHAKAVNFGIVYGISAFSLADDIKVSNKEAQQYIDTYLQKYIGVSNYMDSIRQKAREDGYVTTLCSRRRYLPELKSPSFNVRAFGERLALNTPVQGTAADIIKLAMINVDKRLASEKLDARLVLQVHDELILECAAEIAPLAANILKEEMESAMLLGDIALSVETGIGDSWYDAKK